MKETLHPKKNKRKGSRSQPPPCDFLTLSLSSAYRRPSFSYQNPPCPRPSLSFIPTKTPRARHNPKQVPKNGKNITITPPFPWSAPQRATVLPLDYLISKGITVVSGIMDCQRCEEMFVIEYSLTEAFGALSYFVLNEGESMRERAPQVWMNPVLPKCRLCEHDNCVKPVVGTKKREINWLFLFLGQMIGFCTLEELKYFCKHTKNHRTGAKDRLLYLTYLGLCNQLNPNGPFQRLLS